MEPTPIAALADALAKAQASMTAATKDRVNPAFRAHYATLASCLEACRPALTTNGIAVVQRPGYDGTLVSVETVLLHSSGETISSTLSAPPVKADPQGIGSAITYLRRYGLLAMVGLAPDDDDGEAACGRSEPPPRPARAPAKKETPRPPAPPTSHDPSWGDDRARFCAELSRLGTNYDRVASWAEGKGWGRPSGWTQQRRDKALGYLKDHPDEVPAREPGED